MRFNSAAYDKLFPRPVQTDPAPETVVGTFTPTTDKLEGIDPDGGDPSPDKALTDQEGNTVIIQDNPDPIVTDSVDAAENTTE